MFCGSCKRPYFRLIRESLKKRPSTPNGEAWQPRSRLPLPSIGVCSWPTRAIAAAICFSRGHLQRLTQDHTVTAYLVSEGAVSPQAAGTHPYRHVVTNFLGGDEPGVNVELHSLDLHPDDVLLLCSDGLTGMVSEDRIVAILQKEEKPERACASLVAEANQQGGKDNVTVIVAHMSETGMDKVGTGAGTPLERGH